MSNQTPDDLNNDASPPDFPPLPDIQQNQSQNPGGPAALGSPQEENPSSPITPDLPSTPVAESPGFPVDDADLERWAEQRQAAYASLDAALERHIDEAIRTVAEFKRQAEAEAARTSYDFMVSRDNLRREISALQEEKARLQAQIEETRRTIQEEEARQAQAQSIREEFESEINRLRGQLVEARSFLQATEFEVPEPVLAAFVPPPAPVTGDVFGEAVTPKLPGGSPIVPVGSPVNRTVTAKPALHEPVTLSELEILEPAPEFIRSGPIHAITSSTFAYLQELLMGEPPDVPMADVAQPPAPQEAAPPSLSEQTRNETTGRLRLGGTNLEQTIGLPPRRGQTDQLGMRPPKRRHTTGGLGPIPVQGAEMVSPVPVSMPEVVETTSIEPPPRRSPTSSETEKQQKVVLRELGLQLGLNDPMTPPALNSMSFASGYTPPKGASSLADMLDEINASVSAIFPPMPEVAPATNGGKAAKKVVEPPPPISPDTNLDDYSIEEEPPSPTLQELLDAGEQELAAINEDPTPPENPTPFIGKIGADHPVHFQPGPTITPKPEPLSMLNQEIDAESPADQSLAASRPGEPTTTPLTRSFRPLNIRPLRSREPQEINLPLSMMFPPLTNPANTRQTYVTITNLQGRYTLPMLEKTLRELVGVAQVMVTEFNRQTIIMEIIHRPNLDMVTQFTTLPGLSLSLVKEGPDSLVFMQNSQ